MKAATRDWVDKAEADYAAALVMRRSRKKQSRDIVCFHLQQCIEKYLKARLTEASLSFPKTHDLEQLLVLILPVEPMWAALRPGITALTDYAVEVRYPGKTASVAKTTAMLRVSKNVRSAIRERLGFTR